MLALLVLTVLPVRAQPAEDPAALMRRGRAAGVEAALLQAVDQRAAEQGLSPAQRAQLLAQGVALAEQDLPAGAVLQKTLEGLAKRVPLPVMTSVLDRMQQQTVHAGRVIDAWLQRPDARQLVAEVQAGDARGRTILVENLAEAFVNDVPPRTVEAVLERLPVHVRQRRLSAGAVGTALGVLADLPSARQDPEATAELVVGALDAGFSQAELRRLPPAMQAAQQRHGGSAAQAALDVAREMTRGTPAEEVLGSLLRGEIPGRGVAVGRGGEPGGPPASAGPPPGVGPDDVEKGRGRGTDQGNGRGRGQGQGQGQGQ